MFNCLLSMKINSNLYLIYKLHLFWISSHRIKIYSSLIKLLIKYNLNHIQFKFWSWLVDFDEWNTFICNIILNSKLYTSGDKTKELFILLNGVLMFDVVFSVYLQLLQRLLYYLCCKICKKNVDEWNNNDYLILHFIVRKNKK